MNMLLQAQAAPALATGVAPAAAALTSPRPIQSAPGLHALREAGRWIGTEADGRDRTPFERWYGEPAAGWAGVFLLFCFARGAGVTLCEHFASPAVGAKGCGDVPTIGAWLRDSGQLLGHHEPLRPGDLVLFDWDTPGSPEHIGIIERVLGPDRFATIEGDTAIGCDTGGGSVMRRVRHVTQLQGAARITSA